MYWAHNIIIIIIYQGCLHVLQVPTIPSCIFNIPFVRDMKLN
jgi:hypothetical protein